MLTLLAEILTCSHKHKQADLKRKPMMDSEETENKQHPAAVANRDNYSYSFICYIDLLSSQSSSAALKEGRSVQDIGGGPSR